MSVRHVAILGASGLIGHKLYQVLKTRFDRVTAVMHGSAQRFEAAGIFETDDIIEHMDVRDLERLTGALDAVRPDVVLNCAGITKRRTEIADWEAAIAVNALFPHRLAGWAKERDIRVIHFSTDCVFDGELGEYTEDSATTGRDAYGRTKALGEIRYDHTLTIRSSFIGRELAVHSELLDWFLAQDGKAIKGFTDAWYSGVSTLVMARVVADIIENHPDLGGLYQLASQSPVSKYDLLCHARDAFRTNVDIAADDGFSIRPTLDGSRLREKIGVDLPSWPEMMRELAEDQAPYRHIELG